MHFRIERTRASAECFECQRGAVVSDAGESFGVMDAESEHRRGEIRTVDEGETFFETRK